MESDRAQDESRIRAEGKMYSAGQVAGATFLGSPIAGAWLLAANYRQLGEPLLQRKTLVLGAVSTVALFVLAFFLPDSFPDSVLPAAYTFGMLEVAKQYQGKAYDSHIEAGGLKHSSWRAAGVGVIWLVVVLVILVAAALVLPAEA